MGIVEDLIKENNYKSNTFYAGALGWDALLKRVRGKKAVLFGTGFMANLAFYRLPKDFIFERVVDNNSKKWGISVKTIVPEAEEMRYDLVIESPEVIKEYDKNEIIVLIAGAKRYEEIVSQLELWGISNYHILLFSEIKSREGGLESYNQSERMSEWAEQCCYEKLNKKKIFIQGFGTFSDHGKYISHELINKRDDLDIVWALSEPGVELEKGMRTVLTSNWRRYIYEMSTAYMWIINTIVPPYIKKRPEQLFIHTKHWASITLKRFYLDATTITDNPDNVREWRRNGEMIDFAIVGSKFDEESFKRGFEFNKGFIRAGSPRTDAMFRTDEMKDKVCSHFNLSKDNKLLLYAPTYRYNNQEKGKHIPEARENEIDYFALKKVLVERFGGDWIILVRLHPSVNKYLNIKDLPDHVINAGGYSDSEELCAACDILISDYSSIMFEPAFVKKPVFLFATDKEEYIDKEYDLLLDYDALPFPIAETNEQLVENIQSFDQDKYEKKVTDFLDRYDVHEDGHASERAADFILKLMK